jgi:predicted dehydrogenase
VIGCGSIGEKRANALPERVTLVGCFDVNSELAKSFAERHGILQFSSVEELLQLSNADFIVVCTSHDVLGDIAITVLRSMKSVFIEKPGAINSSILKEVKRTADENGLVVHVGFNHRFHPAISRAIKIFDSGDMGRLMFVRARYGHGGRIGYEKEWRANKSKSGGGELIDQGSHLIDLALAFLGNARISYASTPTYFWDMDVEDNAFVSLINDSGNIAFLHASCTEWKNLFSLEVYCERAKIEVKGLGGSYGEETLIYYKMKQEMGPPEIQSWEFKEVDNSWQEELATFIQDLENNSRKSDNLDISINVLELIEEAYERSGR